jgi:hypothetical protein
MFQTNDDEVSNKDVAEADKAIENIINDINMFNNGLTTTIAPIGV